MSNFKKLFKKIVIGSATLAAPVAALATISCGTTENKTILIAVDGVQQKFYDKAIELFKKTKSGQNGFEIKTIAKDVWGALDLPTGATDKKIVPDIFYAPHDRITTLVASNAVADLDQFAPGLLDRIAKKVKATEEEKKQLRSFGSVVGIDKNTQLPAEKLFGIRHNTEGVIIASTKPLADVKEDLAKPENDTLLELVKQGRAFLRFQDFWYGNGILGAVAHEYKAEDMMKKLLFLKDGKLSTGLYAENPIHVEFKKAVDLMSEFFFPIYEAAYILDSGAYATSVWGKRNIKQDDLKALLNNDMGAVNNKVFELMKEGKLEYGLIGTWDVQVAQTSANAKTFFNAGKLNDAYTYRQASGSWSYLVNVRNNGSSNARKEAIAEFLECVFDSQSFYEYFKSDSKVPFIVDLQKELKTKVDQDSAAQNAKLQELMSKLKYTDVAEFNNDYDSSIQVIDSLSKVGDSASSWENTASEDPLADSNMYGADKLPVHVVLNSTLESKLGMNFKDIRDKYTEKGTGLRNALAAILGLGKLSDLEGNGAPWQVAFTKLNEANVSNELFANAKQGDNAFHVRKLEKIIFGANGDEGKEYDAVVEEFKTALKENKLQDLINAKITEAKKVSQLLAKKAVADEVITKAVKAYLYTRYINQAEVRNLGDKLTKEFQFPAKDKSTKVPATEVIEIVQQYRKNQAVDLIYQTLSSTKSLADGGLNVIQYQPGRIDQSNPQFGNVAWSSWNDAVFGNKELYSEISGTTKTLDAFKKVMYEKLTAIYKEKIDTINSSTESTAVIKFE